MISIFGITFLIPILTFILSIKTVKEIIHDLGVFFLSNLTLCFNYFIYNFILV